MSCFYSAVTEQKVFICAVCAFIGKLLRADTEQCEDCRKNDPKFLMLLITLCSFFFWHKVYQNQLA